MGAPTIYPTSAQQVSPVTDPGSFSYAGAGPQIAQVNASGGTFTLASGAASLTGLTLTTASVFVPTLKTASGTIAGTPYLTAINVSAGTATVAAGGSDNSTYNFMIIG
jgi:hypothetical protein